jgi:peptidoglycan hydrolase-like protein with peptidoglycan-binding domain
VDTLTGRTARRGYAQNQALNAQTASGGGTQNAASSMSANAGQSGAMSETSKSTSSASARTNTHDKSVVRAVQQALNDKGFNPGPIDGKWGPRTQAALAKFQKAQGITASRKLDDQTLAALGVNTPNLQTSQAGSGSNSPAADSSNRISANTSSGMQAQKQ